MSIKKNDLHRTFWAIESIELSHIEYVRLKDMSRKEDLDLNKHLPYTSFFAGAKARLKGLGVGLGLLVVGASSGVVGKHIQGIIPLAILFGASGAFGVLGVYIYGTGLMGDLSLFRSYLAQRQELVEAFKESVDYKDYCRIRKINYRPTEEGYALNKILNR